MQQYCGLQLPLTPAHRHLTKCPQGIRQGNANVRFPAGCPVLRTGLRVNRGGRVHVATRPGKLPADMEEVEECIAQGGVATSNVVATVGEKRLASTSTPTPKIPVALKHGLIGVGICAVAITLVAGVRSMWIHKNDENLQLKLKKASKDAAARLARANEEHKEELQKSTWEYSSKLSAKESEARAREREVKDTLEADFRKSLGEKLSQREKAVTGLLKAQHAKDIQALEAKWAAKLETKEDELAKQKNIIAEIKKQVSELKASQNSSLKREKDFEKKVAKYSEAISIVAPGGELDKLKQRVSDLEKENRVQAQELRKLKPDTVIAPSITSNGAAPVKTLQLVTAGTIVPDEDKAETGGEDAFFVSSKGHGAFGVADGVGAWAEEGVDPSKYPTQFMDAAAQMLGRSANSKVPRVLDVLAHAHGKVRIPGSATALVAALKGDGDLELANVGDCGARVIRDGKCVFVTRPHVHEFNMPYQLGCATYLEDTDLPSDADLYHFKVQAGDIIVGGSDGLFDNIFDEDIAAIISRGANGGALDAATAQSLSEKIASTAHENGKSKTMKTPWAVESAAAGHGGFFSRFLPQGGKIDDCTVVVGFIQ